MKRCLKCGKIRISDEDNWCISCNIQIQELLKKREVRTGLMSKLSQKLC